MRTLLIALRVVSALGLLAIIGYMGYGFATRQYSVNVIGCLPVIVVCSSISAASGIALKRRR